MEGRAHFSARLFLSSSQRGRRGMGFWKGIKDSIGGKGSILAPESFFLFDISPSVAPPRFPPRGVCPVSLCVYARVCVCVERGSDRGCLRGPVALSREPIWVLNCNREKRGGGEVLSSALWWCTCVHRSATIALSAVLSHQNIKGGARSRRCIDFSPPFLSSPLSFLSSPPVPIVGTCFFSRAAREREREEGRRGRRKKGRAPPSIDRASLFRRSISNPPSCHFRGFFREGGGEARLLTPRLAWISLMNFFLALESDRKATGWVFE